MAVLNITRFSKGTAENKSRDYLKLFLYYVPWQLGIGRSQ